MEGALGEKVHWTTTQDTYLGVVTLFFFFFGLSSRTMSVKGQMQGRHILSSFDRFRSIRTDDSPKDMKGITNKRKINIQEYSIKFEI